MISSAFRARLATAVRMQAASNRTKLNRFTRKFFRTHGAATYSSDGDPFRNRWSVTTCCVFPSPPFGPADRGHDAVSTCSRKSAASEATSFLPRSGDDDDRLQELRSQPDRQRDAKEPRCEEITLARDAHKRDREQEGNRRSAGSRNQTDSCHAQNCIAGGRAASRGAFRQGQWPGAARRRSVRE